MSEKSGRDETRREKRREEIRDEGRSRRPTQRCVRSVWCRGRTDASGVFPSPPPSSPMTLSHIPLTGVHLPRVADDASDGATARSGISHAHVAEGEREREWERERGPSQKVRRAARCTTCPAQVRRVSGHCGVRWESGRAPPTPAGANHRAAAARDPCMTWGIPTRRLSATKTMNTHRPAALGDRANCPKTKIPYKLYSQVGQFARLPIETPGS